jgi:Kef-type K+ transport system membrane component KefB
MSVIAQAGGQEAHLSITVLIALLLIASGVATATKWVRLPYTLALVIVGLVISPMHFLPKVHEDSSLEDLAQKQNTNE